MDINIYLVGKIIHYTPLYSAVEKLRKSYFDDSLNVNYIETKNDLEIIKKALSEQKNLDDIELYLTSIPDIEERLIKIIGFNHNELSNFYNDCVSWMMMIDRTPISIVCRSEKKQNDFDSLWKKPNSQTNRFRPKISCYPMGTTVEWFINKSFNQFGAFEVFHVPFGEMAEFDAISIGTCEYAVTLEPWLVPNGQKILYDIPIAPFGFTALLSRKHHFYHPRKREIMYELVKVITNEIANLYRTFEPSLYDWQMFKNWKKAPHNGGVNRGEERKNYVKLVAKQINKPGGILEGLHWMCSRRIWAIDPLLPLGNDNNRHFKSASELTTELLAEKEKESQIQWAGVHTIHHLKNEMMNKVSIPMRKYIDWLARRSDESAEEFKLRDLEKIKKHVDDLSDKFKDWLNALNYKLSKEEKNFSVSTYELDKYLFKLQQQFQLDQAIKLELKGISPSEDGYLLDRAQIPSVLMKFVMDEIIGNAVAAYRTELEKFGESLSYPVSIHVVWERIKLFQKEYIQIEIENNGPKIPDDKILNLGKRPTKSSTGGTGFGLHFLNIALEVFDCHMVDTTHLRYFFPKNIIDENGNQLVRFTVHFPAKEK